MTQSRIKIRFFLFLLAVFGILSFIHNIPLALADFSAADLELKTGTLTANGDITSMVQGADGTLYLGGDFTTISGTTRNKLAAIATDGTLTSWDPNANSSVKTLAISGSTIYVGGAFTTIGGTTRNRLAAIDTSGNLTSWDPNANGTVRAFVINGSTVYAGGDFTTIGGTTRNYLAAIDASGTLTSWNPNASSTVSVNNVVTLVISGSTIYAGGDFDTIGGTTRNKLAAIATDGTLTSWDPNANAFVWTLAISGSTIYVGGGFTTIGGTTRNNLAAIATDGTLTSWNPNANGNGLLPLVISGSTIYVGGIFTTIGGTTRNRLAAIATDGTLTSWDPNANGAVRAFVISGSTVYVGGAFTSMSGNTNIIRFAQFTPRSGGRGGRMAAIARAFPLPTITTFVLPPVNTPVSPDLTSATSTSATSTSSTTLSVLPPHPTASQIQTAISELTNQINQIQKNLTAPDIATLITQVSQQIVQIQEAIGAPPTTPPPAGAVPQAGSYQKPLFLEQKNDEVRALQTFLKSQGAAIYPEGLITGYFGPLTKEAVGRFQLQYGLVDNKDDPGYGYLGPKTRAKINSLLGL